MDGWAITNLDAPELTPVTNGLEVEVQEDSVLNEEEAMYWIAPEPYLANKVNLVDVMSFISDHSLQQLGIIIFFRF